MLRRLAIVAYIFLSIPLIVIPIYILLGTHFWKSLNVSTYQARCTKNKELVVLEGTTDNSPYTFTNQDAKTAVLDWDVEERLRFYCHYYSEIQQINTRYTAAVNESERIKANQEFMKLWNEKTKPNVKNYSLELLNTKSDYRLLWYGVATALISTVVYFTLLQIARIIYQYIVFGSFHWHPYKGLGNKAK